MTEKDPRRRFNQGEKNAMYIAWDGRCADCKVPLGDDWEGDHDDAHSRGGRTEWGNGRPLCKRCNDLKGSSVNYQDSFDPTVRSFQGELIGQVQARFIAGEKLTVGLIWCGSGKTLAAQAVATALMRIEPAQRKRIRYVLWFTPRVILAQQGELDYRHTVLDANERPVIDVATGDPGEGGNFKLFDARCRLEYLWHRNNKAPLLPENAQFVGLISTYQSLVEDFKKPDRGPMAGQLFLKWARKHSGEFLLIGDEAQFAGAPIDDDDEESPAAGQYIKELAEYAAHTLLMTATADRADGRKLVLCEDRYVTDAKGRLHLEPDVEAPYWQGIAQRYLREFDVAIHQTKVRLRSGIEYDLSQSSKQPPEERAALAAVLRDPDVWMPLCDLTVKRLRYMQQIDEHYRALFACMQVEDARHVCAYLERKGLKVLLAVSQDGAKAKENLRKFKEASYDALVTVRMAFIGYDCPEITAVCVLTNYRDMGHLAQLVFRGGRVWKDGGPAKSQTMHLAFPDDEAAVKFIDYLRTEQARGIAERKEPGEGPQPPTGTAAELDKAWVASVRGATNNRDISAEEYAEGQAILDELGPITTPDQVRQLQLRLFGMHEAERQPRAEVAQDRPPGTGPRKTGQELVEDDKRAAARRIGQYLREHGYEPGHYNYAPTRARLTRRIGNAFGVNSTDEITTQDRAAAYLEHVRSFLKEIEGESL